MQPATEEVSYKAAEEKREERWGEETCREHLKGSRTV